MEEKQSEQTGKLLIEQQAQNYVIKVTDYVSHTIELLTFLLVLNIGFTAWNIFLLFNGVH